MATPRMTPAARRNRVSARRSSHLGVLKDLVEPVYPDPTELFERGLKLLVKQLLVDRAVIVRITDLGYETLWWATQDGQDIDLAAFDPARDLCPRVLRHAPRTLVVRDALQDPEPRDGPRAEPDPSVRSYIGVPLRREDKVIGVLSVQSSLPKKYTRSDVILVSMVASLLGSAMEIELLKQELHSTREALDLTMSVVEDSALEASGTRLPSRRYLDIWLRAYLFMARRRSEPMALLLWHVALNRETRKGLREISEHARGEDLLVDMGKDTFLLLLPRTTPAGAGIVVERVRALLGQIPVGLAGWDPDQAEDRDDLTLSGALRRAQESLKAARGALKG